MPAPITHKHLTRYHIAFFITGFITIPPKDGGTFSMLTLLKRLSQNGAGASFYCLTNKHHPTWLQNKDITIITKSPQRLIFYHKRYPIRFTLAFTDIDIKEAYRQKKTADFLRLKKLGAALLKDEKIDIIMTANTDIFSMAAASEIPAIRLHHVRSDSLFNKNNMPYHTTFRKLLPKFKLVCGSKFLSRKLKKSFHKQSVTLYPLIDFKDLPHIKKPTGEYITMLHSNLGKGLLIFLNIAKNLPDKKFLLIGDATLKVKFKKEGRSNIEVLPWQTDVSIPFQKTKILIVPSLCEESYPRSIIEAIHYGIPVIATNVGGIKETKLLPKFLIPINENERQKIDFYTNTFYHTNTILSYIKTINTLDDDEVYQKTKTAIEQACSTLKKRDKKNYTAFKDWLQKELIK